MDGRRARRAPAARLGDAGGGAVSETAESIALREKTLNEQKVARAQAVAHAPGRPTKRDRRRLEDFLNEP